MSSNNHSKALPTEVSNTSKPASTDTKGKAPILSDYLEIPEKKSKSVEKTVKVTGKKSKVPDWVKPIPEPQSFQLPNGSKQEQWDWLKDKVLNDPVCNEHIKAEHGKKVVFGVGNLDADIFFCGEAPGEDEEVQGEPFVGKAGQLLDKIVKAMGISREQTYIGNIMNWRPEHDMPWGNRPPTETELRYCLPYLEAQVEILQPKVIMALGATAANGLLGYDPQRSVGKCRGQWFSFHNIPLVITYHPSYLLRNNTNKTKRMVWEDMLMVMEQIGMPISEKQKSFFL